MQCRSHVAQLGRLYPKFEASETKVLVVLGEPVKKAKKYAEILKTPFPVLADPEREVYHRYHLEKAYILIQRTASVIVNKEGIIRYLKRATNPMTWLQESQELLEAVQSLGATE